MEYLRRLFVITTLLFASSLFASSTPFESLPSKALQPLDGEWRATVHHNETKGCPTMMEAMLAKQSFPTKDKSMTFSKPFTPHNLFKESKNLDWQEVTPNHWRATMIPVEGSIKVAVKWELGVLSEDKMEIFSHIRMDLPIEMRAMLGGSGSCQLNTHATFQHLNKGATK
jgi:hypothetical protein